MSTNEDQGPRWLTGKKRLAHTTAIQSGRHVVHLISFAFLSEFSR
jgi:hypothetical protein